MHKYLAKRLSQPGILVFKEKHATRYFVCHNRDEYCRVAMKMLRERASKEFCWYYDDPKYPDMSLTRAKEIIETNDLEAAYEFMDLRSDAEYEDMDIEYPEEYS